MRKKGRERKRERKRERDRKRERKSKSGVVESMGLGSVSVG